jgi:hypothetical protein
VEWREEGSTRRICLGLDSNRRSPRAPSCDGGGSWSDPCGPRSCTPQRRKPIQQHTRQSRSEVVAIRSCLAPRRAEPSYSVG